MQKQPDGNTTFRTYQNKSDAYTMAKIRQDSVEHDNVDPLSTLESIPTAHDILRELYDDNCNPETDILIVEVNDSIIGYSKIGWWEENDGTNLYLHNSYLLPEYRDRGIFEEMLQWCENRIKEIAQYQSSDKKVFGSNATTTEKEKTKLLLTAGYEKVFSLVEMEFVDFDSLKDLSLPINFKIQPVVDNQLRRIWDTNNKIYAQRAFVSAQTEEDYKDFIQTNNDLDLWTVAWHGDEIAGFVISSVRKGRAEISEVSVVEKYRRNGLATVLITKNLRRLQKKGIKIARLHTNGENIAGARELYEKIGFRHVKDFNRYRKTMKL